MKKYNQAPLPFQGQKRRFLTQFREALNDISTKEKLVFVDLFGGSGLLSQTVKNMFPEATVVWNDYDNYWERLQNVGKTNKLLADLRVILKDYPNDKKIAEDVKSRILSRIKQEKGFVDYITLSASLLFSGKYVINFEELSKQTMYKTIKQSDYTAEGYLQVVERVSMDYKELFEQYAGQQNVVFLLDPPYLSTDSKTYTSDKYWKLSDYLDVLDCLQETKYFYFTSNKSSIIELCGWVSTRTSYVNPFADSSRRSVAGSVNYNSSYEDIMVYKIEQ